jgi:hypothetical protein
VRQRSKSNEMRVSRRSMSIRYAASVAHRDQRSIDDGGTQAERLRARQDEAVWKFGAARSRSLHDGSRRSHPVQGTSDPTRPAS